MRLFPVLLLLALSATQATNVTAQATETSITDWSGADATTLTAGNSGATFATDDGSVSLTTTTLPSSTSLLQSLTPQELPRGEWHMKPVRAVHARVQSDAPIWHNEQRQFVSKMGHDDFAKGYEAGMDGVNTASVEGALMYVQAEGINYNTRSPELRCQRKNNMKFVVFYELVIAQTNETLALYQDTADQHEYGPMVPMDQGRCSPTSTSGGKDVLPKECYYFNGDKGEPNVGPFVGGESKVGDLRAPYPENIWFSLPHTCPLKIWAEKTPECRASTRKGLCDVGVLPDGIHCTFAYSILGYIAIDNIVGITQMQNNRTDIAFTDFKAFCEAGGVEFKASADGEWEQSIAFWRQPQDEAANAARAKRVVDAYQQQLTSGASLSSLVVDARAVSLMRPLPSVDEMAKENPPCYENVKRCSDGVVACRRETYAQVCRLCSSSSSAATAAGCQTAPSGFTFPELAKAVGEIRDEGDADPDATGMNKNRSGEKSKTDRVTSRAGRGASQSELSGLAAAGVVASTIVAMWY